MTDSILNTIKQQIGVLVSDTAFDADILLLINAAIAVLRQLGVGPETPMLVADKDTEWSALTTNSTVLAMAKQFIFLRTKLTFDAPGTSFIGDSYQRTLDELTFRIEVEANPAPPIPPEEAPEEV